MQGSLKKTFIVLCILFALLFMANAYFSISYYRLDAVKFQNLDRLQLSAKYSQSKNGEGVLIVTDLTHDKSELTGLIYEFTRAGYGVYVFDFPSQGSSGGSIPFHANTGTYMAEQFYCAAVSYSQLANIAVDKIHIVAYGAGARAVLQTVSMGFINPASLTLVGAEINLDASIQYDFMNYSAESQLAWIQNLNGYTGSCPIHIIYSPLDNISTKPDNTLLAQQLSNTDGISSALAANTVKLTEIRFVAHSELVNSTRVTKAVFDNIAEISGVATAAYSPWIAVRTVCRAGMYLLVFALSYVYYRMIRKNGQPRETAKIDFKQFYKAKWIFWLANILVLCLMPLLLYMLPVNYPYNDMLKFTLVASYGITMLLVYKFTNFNRNMGQSLFRRERTGNSRAALLVAIAYTALFSLISVSGTFSIFAFKSKWLWIFIFTAVCGLFFYIDEKERKAFARTPKDELKLIAVNYLGCFAMPVLMLTLGQVDTALRLAVMASFLAFLFLVEKILRAYNTSTGMNAAVKAFLFQLVIFAQGAMWHR